MHADSLSGTSSISFVVYPMKSIKLSFFTIVIKLQVNPFLN